METTKLIHNNSVAVIIKGKTKYHLLVYRLSNGASGVNFWGLNVIGDTVRSYKRKDYAYEYCRRNLN